MRTLAEAQIEANEQLFLTQRKERERQQRVEVFNNILTSLAKTSFEQYGSLENAFRTITGLTADALGIERVSVWNYTGNSIISQDLYQKTEKQHSSGLELSASDFPAYFKGIAEGEVISASEAHTHPNTFEFTEIYFKPLNIFSLLDVPVRVGGQLSGVVCCENTENIKYWNDDEINFVRSIADIVALMIEADKRKQAEEELKEATERLDLAVSGTNDGIWDWDMVNNKVYFSPRWKEMLGYEDHEIENSFDAFVALQHPEDVALVNEKISNYLSGKADLYVVELRMRSKNGDYKWIQARGVALKDAEGKPYRMAGSHSDIDERKQAEENIKKLAKQFQDLFDNSRDALLLLDDRGFFQCNEAAVEVYGCSSKEDILGKNPIDFSPSVQKNSQGSGEAAMGHIQKAMQEGSALFEWTHLKKDGSEFPAEVLLSRVNFEGRTVLQATVRDITERKKAEEELKKAFEKMRKSEEDMRMLAEAQLEANERLMMAEKNLKETLELEQKQKSELDRLVGQLKETQTQLVHNEKMASLGQLTAGIAHEINNPINFVYNGIDTLKISLDDLMEIVNKYNELDQSNGNKEEIIDEVKKLKEDLDYEELTQDIAHLVSDIKKGAVRTMEIVKGLRVFSRLDEEERKMASIKDCLESTLILLNNKIKGRIELKTYYDETMPEILCYPGQLNQVFMNIINNAIQAVPEERKDGVVSIYTENMQENVVIRIKDNGTGMSEQVKRRIFEPFFTTKQVGVGTGLGLSITFGIIEKHGGSIFVNSEEGRGTEFVIQLPKMLN